MAKKNHSEQPRLKRRLFGYKRSEVDGRIADLQAQMARQTDNLEFEVGRLTEELIVATTADDDLALRATRRAVETILTGARAEAAALIAKADVVIDLRDTASAASDGEPVAF